MKKEMKLNARDEKANELHKLTHASLSAASMALNELFFQLLFFLFFFKYTIMVSFRFTFVILHIWQFYVMDVCFFVVAMHRSLSDIKQSDKMSQFFSSTSLHFGAKKNRANMLNAQILMSDHRRLLSAFHAPFDEIPSKNVIYLKKIPCIRIRVK